MAAGFALFLPVVANDSFYFSLIFLKSVLFRAVVECMLLLYVVLAALAPAYRPRLHLISYALLAWFGVMFISSLPGVSVDAWTSWWGDFRRMGGLVSQLHLLAYFFVLSQSLKRERDWLSLFTASLFFGVLMGFSGMVEYLGLGYLYRFPQESRIEGAAGNAGFLAANMLLNFFIVLWLLSRKDKDSAYPLIAKVWLTLLVLLDLFAICWDQFSGAGITSGLALPPVAIFALILHAATICWFIMRRNVRAGQVFLVLFGAWCIFWMYLTQTRGAMLGLVGSVLFLLGWYLCGSASRKAKLVCGGLLLFVVLMSSLMLLNRQSAWVRSHPTLFRYTTLSLKDPSIENRVATWRAAAVAIQDRPIFGWGLENFKNAFDAHFPNEIYRSLYTEVWFDRAHNLFIDVATTTGLIGLAAYLTFYGLILTFLMRQWYRTKDPAGSLVLVALLLAYLLQGLFTFDTINTDVTLYLVLAYVVYLHAGSKSPQPDPVRRPVQTGVTWKGRASIGAAAIILPAAWTFAVSRPFESNRLLQRARLSSKVIDPRTGAVRTAYGEGLMGLYQRADEYQTTGCHELHEVFANYALDVARSSDIPIDWKIRVIRKGVDFFKESIQRIPANARYYLYMASLVNATSDIVRQADPLLAGSLAETTLAMLQKAEVLSPSRPQVYLERSQTFLFLGRPEDRLAAFEKGAALCVAIKEPHVDLITLYIASGRFNDAAREWQDLKERGFKLTAADYDRVISFYDASKKLEPIVELYREQLKETPNDATVLARLAGTYRDLGEVDLARQTAMKAATLSPKVAAELQTFLDSLKRSSR